MRVPADATEPATDAREPKGHVQMRNMAIRFGVFVPREW